MSLYHALSSFPQWDRWKSWLLGDKNVLGHVGRVFCCELKLKTATTLPTMIYDRHVYSIHAEWEKRWRKKWATKSMQPLLRFHEEAWICLMTFSSTLLIRLWKGIPISVLRHLECLWKCPWKWMKTWLNLRGRREMEMEAKSDRIFFLKD